MSTRRRRPRKQAEPGSPRGENEPFSFQWPHGSGRRYTLPTQLRFGVLRQASKAGNDFDQIVAVLEAVADPDALAAIDDMTVAQVEALFVAWQRHMGVSVGESSRSSP